MEDFIEFLDGAAPNDQHAIFAHKVSENVLKALQGLDQDLFEPLVRFYAEWVERTNFDWLFCDVVIPRLEAAFAVAAVGGRAELALASAKLGRSHNRWFVMRRVLAMCGPALDDAIYYGLQAFSGRELRRR